MKKTVVTLSLCCMTLFGMLLYQGLSEQPVVSASGQITAAEQAETPLYLVRAENGVLAIYPYGSDTALEVTDIRLTSLREYDQRLMQQGFPLYSEHDLTAFLEDFGS